MKPTLISLVILSLLFSFIVTNIIPSTYSNYLNADQEAKFQECSYLSGIKANESSCSAISIKGYTCCYVETKKTDPNDPSYPINSTKCLPILNDIVNYNLKNFIQSNYNDSISYERIYYNPYITDAEIKKAYGIITYSCGNTKVETTIFPAINDTDYDCSSMTGSSASPDNCDSIKLDGKTCCYVITEKENTTSNRRCEVYSNDFVKKLKENLNKEYENNLESEKIDWETSGYDKEYIKEKEKEYKLKKTIYMCGDKKVQISSSYTQFCPLLILAFLVSIL